MASFDPRVSESFTEEELHEITSRADEDLQQKTTFREKRASYRDIINKIQVTNNSNECRKETLTEMNQLFDGVTRIREMAYDSHAVDLFAERELRNIENMQINLEQFNELEFCTKMLEYMGVSNQNEQLLEGEEDSRIPHIDDETWIKFGQEAMTFCKRAPSFHYMFGSFEMGEVKVKERQIKKRELRDKTTQPTKPLEVKSLEKKDRDKTTEEVENVYEILNHVYEENDEKPVCYFRFCIDPSSFAVTIENMFYVSFLIKDGCAAISLGENKLPVLTPLNKDEDNAIAGPKKCSQLVQTLTVGEYKELIQALKIEKAVIQRKFV